MRLHQQLPILTQGKMFFSASSGISTILIKPLSYPVFSEQTKTDIDRIILGGRQTNILR